MEYSGSKIIQGIKEKRFSFYGIILIIVLLFCWEFASKSVKFPFFPSFTDVLNAAFRVAFFGDIEGYRLMDHVLASIFRVIFGFCLAYVTGFPTGLAMGLKRSIYETLKAVIEPLRFVPPIAWLPLVYLFAPGYMRYVTIIWLGAFFPILLNTIAGVKRINPTFVDVAKVFGADNKALVFKVVIPGAMPEVLAGARIGLGVGWMCIVAAEMMGGEPVGLGRLIIKSTELLQIDVCLVGILLIGLIGLITNEVFINLEKRLFKWRAVVEI